MATAPIVIKRYPNRRFYARAASAYVSLAEIERMIRDGKTVEIRDSQTGEDLTRTVLTQIILERQPDKIALFPADMLHFIVRSNDAMAGFLRDYFRHSLTYLEYLQRHGPTPAPLSRPVHWVKAWLDGFNWPAAGAHDAAACEPPESAPAARRDDAAETNASHATPDPQRQELATRVERLEKRIRQLEAISGEGPAAREDRQA